MQSLRKMKKKALFERVFEKRSVSLSPQKKYSIKDTLEK